MPSPERNDETLCLGGFLRSRRERLSPAEAGLPEGARRRTPGLRREEVAALAGISVDYLIRLEQGRETRPSGEVLRSLARALHLSADEGAYLKRIAHLASEPEECRQRLRTSEVDDTTVRLLDRMVGTPAYVADGLTDLHAWNSSFHALMAATSLFQTEPPNMLRYTFLDPEAQRLFVDWPSAARTKIGHLQAGVGDPRLPNLVGELAVGSSEFAQFWAEHQVAFKRTGSFALNHPVAGEMRLDYDTLKLPEPSTLQIITYLPSDAASQAALDDLEREHDLTEPTGTADVQQPYLRIVNG